ncbi:MAG TPA: YdcF family protein, partial [Leptolinea sp.]
SMFIFLSKFLPLLIYPLGLSTILIVLSLVFNHRKKLRVVFIVAALIIIFLSGNRWISYNLARSLEWQFISAKQGQSAQAIVVLGGGTESLQPPRTAVEVNGAGDRMIHAADLYHKGLAPLVLLSGGNITWMDATADSPASDMRQIMLKLGVSDADMILQTKSQNTYEDAYYSSAILKNKGITKILLVTSAMHMPRSVALFQKQGLEVIPSPTDFTITTEGWQQTFSPNLETFLTDLMPNTSSLGLTTSVLKEYIGYFAYHLQGWL